MTRIVDNSKEKLSATLNNAFEDANDIAIATAYFKVNGYGELKEALRNKPLKFLLGRAQTESVKWEDEIIRELEENEDERRYFELLQDAVEFFEGEKVSVRALKGPFFHGKAYIGATPALDNMKRGIGVVGSSNFTRGGLVNNRELNMLNTDREVVQELISWFQEAWEHSTDFKEEFLSVLKNYVTTRSPYEVAAKALYETYRDTLDVSVESQKVLETLMPHQKLTVRDALLMLERYNGVVVADATGLGKSRIALSLALNAIREGKKCLLIAPASVLATTWKHEFAKTHISLDETVPTTSLYDHSDYFDGKKFSDVGFVIVDEAHDFRRPSTKRYGALRDLLLRTKAQVVLATATPVNNSLMDLYSLLSLYLPEDCITDIHGQTLKGFFTANQKRWLRGEPIDMEKVLERFMVRHSRRLAVALGEGKLKFPERELDMDPLTRYDARIDYEKINTLLDRMNFMFYDLSIDRLSDQLKMPDGTPVPKAVEQSKRDKLKKLVKAIVIIGIFKRLESSSKAFEDTLGTLRDYIEKAIVFAEEKSYFIPSSFKNDPLFDFDEELPSPEDVFKEEKYSEIKENCKLSQDEAVKFVAKCKEDIATIDLLLSEIPSNDSKFDTFALRLSAMTEAIASGKNNGVIIFSQFTSTAAYLYDRLSKSSAALPVMMVTGSICRDAKGHNKEKSAIIEEFQSNGGILVSTDVLSEGQNLQNAQYVVNYDFPWNPVVLIQRIGRVDRMGSPYDTIYVSNILPVNGNRDDPKTLEHFLHLMEKLYSKLDAIRATIGIDATTLGEEADPKDFGLQIEMSKGNFSAIEKLSRELEQFTSDPLDTLAKIIQDRSIEWLERIPDGIGAFKKGKRDAMFVLFRNGSDLYWRTKYFDGNREMSDSINDTVSILLDGESENHGERIDYGRLLERIREMKESLKKELNERRQREITLGGTPVRATKTVKEIFDELANSGGDGEVLAARFRARSNNQSLVSALYKARKESRLVDKARELLQESTDSGQEPAGQSSEIKLKRVCWCWIQPSETGKVTADKDDMRVTG